MSQHSRPLHSPHCLSLLREVMSQHSRPLHSPHGLSPLREVMSQHSHPLHSPHCLSPLREVMSQADERNMSQTYTALVIPLIPPPPPPPRKKEDRAVGWEEGLLSDPPPSPNLRPCPLFHNPTTFFNCEYNFYF